MYENKPQMAVAGTKHTIITDTNKIIHRKSKQTIKPNISESLIPSRRKPEGKRWKVHNDRTTGGEHQYSGTLRKMQYTGARRKRVEQHTDPNDSRTRLGKHKDQPSVRQKTKEVNQRQKERTNTWNNNQCKTNNRRRSKRNHSGRSKR